jgi:hypothetical protein
MEAGVKRKVEAITAAATEAGAKRKVEAVTAAATEAAAKRKVETITAVAAKRRVQAITVAGIKRNVTGAEILPALTAETKRTSGAATPRLKLAAPQPVVFSPVTIKVKPVIEEIPAPRSPRLEATVAA